MREDLTQILKPWNAASGNAARDDAEAQIWRKHGRLAAIFVLDLAGFTRGVAKGGLVAHLDKINRLLNATDPIISEFGGETVKHEADNCFALFGDVEPAVLAAKATLTMLAGQRTSGGIGIAFGPILYTGTDYFGQPVNIACKLGEDIAQPGEILIEDGAATMLSVGQQKDGAMRTLRASGIQIVAMVKRC